MKLKRLDKGVGICVSFHVLVSCFLAFQLNGFFLLRYYLTFVKLQTILLRFNKRHETVLLCERLLIRFHTPPFVFQELLCGLKVAGSLQPSANVKAIIVVLHPYYALGFYRHYICTNTLEHNPGISPWTHYKYFYFMISSMSGYS